jgi:hypothetical protein
MSAATGTIETTTRAGARLRLENITYRHGRSICVSACSLPPSGQQAVPAVGG